MQANSDKYRDINRQYHKKQDILAQKQDSINPP